jgi:RES domain-containing protein
LTRIWRLTPRRHLRRALTGEGARRFGGRWNSPGHPVVYTSATLSLASLETLVHLGGLDLPPDLMAIPCDLPDGLRITVVEENDLPRNWRRYPAPERLRRIGDEWLRKGITAVLSVPSAVVPPERNYLLHPGHPEMERIDVGRAFAFRFDPRLRAGQPGS